MTGSSRVTIEDLLEHASWVKSLARQLIGSREAADDLVQDTWLSALEHPPRDRSGLAGWLRTLMRRRAARIGSDDRARLVREGKSTRRGDAAPAADLVAQAEGQRLVVGLVLELPEPYRSTLLLRYFGGMSFVEIAEQTGTPDATVRVHHQRALEEIRRSLAARGKDDPSLWRSVALLAGAGAGAKTAAAATATVGVIVMSVKAKLGMAACLVAAIAMFAIWSPWRPEAAEADKSATLGGADAADVAAAGAGGSASDASGAAPSGPAAESIRPRAVEAGQSILGRVVDPSGAPVGGATVAAYPLTMTELVSADAPDRPKSWPRIMKTDAEGNFAIGDLAPSSPLEIVATADGFEPATQTPVVADAPIVLRLGTGVRLRGIVREFGGAPIPGARVRVNEISGLLQKQKSATAGTDGRYEVRGLGPDSRFYIEVEADGFAPLWINVLPPPDASDVSTKDFYMGHGAEITVAAVDAETGAPIQNARILGWAYTLAHGMERPGGTVTNPKHIRVLGDVRTGADGRARIRNVPSWGVHPNSTNQVHSADVELGGVAAMAEGYATGSRRLPLLDDGATESVTLSCRPAATLAGRVVDQTGAPVTGAQLWFRATAPIEDDWMPGPLRPDIDSLKSGANGAYVLSGVPSSRDGNVEVTVTAWMTGERGDLYGTTRMTVRVSGTGLVRAPDLVLERGRGKEFRFRILDPADAPVWGARIDDYPSADPLAITDRDGRAKCAVPIFEDEDGRAEMPPVFVRLAGFATERLQLSPDGREEIVVRLRAARSIAGRVVHEDGSPAAGAMVSAVSAEPPVGAFSGIAPADRNGMFEIRDLLPGKYDLEASMGPERGEGTQASLANVPAGTRDVRITVPLRPRPSRGSVEVEVRERGTKRPVMRCLVSLRGESGETPAIPTAPGSFVASGLAPGRWTVVVRSPRHAGLDPVEIVVGADSKPVVVQVELERGVTMRGHFRLSGLTSFANPRGACSGPGAPETTVATDGAFTITGLKAGASYEVSLTHQKSRDVWEALVAPGRIVVPDQTADLIERDIELVVSGGLGIRIDAPRLFDSETVRPKTAEQRQLAKESRIMVRAVEGTWATEMKPLRMNNFGWRLPYGRYLVRLEIPGIDPQEKTVKVDSDSTWVDFVVP